ncbi:hypothetical protein [Prosthecobacter fusiformis]|nr:hypothetical protein [Prosthecobacter fusiformis]
MLEEDPPQTAEPKQPPAASAYEQEWNTLRPEVQNPWHSMDEGERKMFSPAVGPEQEPAIGAEVMQREMEMPAKSGFQVAPEPVSVSEPNVRPQADTGMTGTSQPQQVDPNRPASSARTNFSGESPEPGPAPQSEGGLNTLHLIPGYDPEPGFNQTDSKSKKGPNWKWGQPNPLVTIKKSSPTGYAIVDKINKDVDQIINPSHDHLFESSWDPLPWGIGRPAPEEPEEPEPGSLEYTKKMFREFEEYANKSPKEREFEKFVNHLKFSINGFRPSVHGPLIEAMKKEDSETEWGFFDAAQYGVESIVGGKHLKEYKDAYVKNHNVTIQVMADIFDIPPEVLAGVAWMEAGGSWDAGEDTAGFLASEHGLSSRPVGERSFGEVQIQLRHAARNLGMPGSEPVFLRDVANRIYRSSAWNLYAVASHLDEIRRQKFPGVKAKDMTKEHVMLIGDAYNAGAQKTTEQARQKSNYGPDLVQKIDWIRNMLSPVLKIP